MQDILTKGERIEMIEEAMGFRATPWVETWFSKSGDARVAKVALPDGSQVWCPAPTDSQALADLLQAVQS